MVFGPKTYEEMERQWRRRKWQLKMSLITPEKVCTLAEASWRLGIGVGTWLMEFEDVPWRLRRYLWMLGHGLTIHPYFGFAMRKHLHSLTYVPHRKT